jgi:hypothetical protein
MKFFARVILILVFFVATSACSNIGSNGQFTNKVEAPEFVTQLYNTVTKTITVAHPEAAHISWMGFIESNNYKYFKITRVQVGSQVIVANGQETNGELFTATSNAVLTDISVSAGGTGTTGYSSGSINTGTAGNLTINVQYSPLVAVASENEPHKAYLIVAYDEPDPGYLRIEIKGYTQGVKEGKCTRSVDSMTTHEYTLQDSAIDLYFCSMQVAPNNQANTPQDPADPDYHGVNTNLVSVPFPTDVVPFYQVDEETVCLLTNPTPTIPNFTLPIPEGLSPIDSMEIGMAEGSYAECTLDTDGNIFCDENILIDSLVSTSGFTLSNTGFTAEEMVTTDCPDFGAISGSGTFNDDDMSVLFMGKTLADPQTTMYKIVDSLIVGVMRLKKN